MQLNTPMILQNQHIKSVLVFFIITTLFFTIALLRHPIGYADNLLAVSLIILVINHKKIKFDLELKKPLWLFLGFLIYFSITSSYPRESIKGLYDIIRGLLIFPVTLYFLQLLKNTKINYLTSIYLIIILLYLAGHFFFRINPQSPHFFFAYGLSPNPNPTAFNILYVCLIAYIIAAHKIFDHFLLTTITLIAIVLLYYANSRNAILAGTAAVLIPVIFAKIRWQSRAVFIFCAIAIFTYFFSYVNYKQGFSSHGRINIWNFLIDQTINGATFIGHGLNTTKALVEDTIEHPKAAHYAHNIFVDLFVQTGILGLIFFTLLVIYTFFIFFKFNYKTNRKFYASIAGITFISIVLMFDKKFASFSTIGTLMVFLATLISSKKYVSGKTSGDIYQ